MRKLLLLRGIPGSGKSTFIRTHGLEGYTLSADVLRMAYASPILEANGTMRIPADNDKAVWRELLALMEKRMVRGELIIIDATHAHPRSFGNYQQLAQKYRYQAVCIDFADIAFEVCMQRNQGREAYEIVPASEMQRMYKNIQHAVMPAWITVVQPDELLSFLANKPKDVSKYQVVHHIGDVHGCYDSLKKYFDTYGIQDDELYIFTGDLLGHGAQNATVMQWVLDNHHRPNFVFIEGNQDFLYQTCEYFHYTFASYEVLVTHAGLSTLPKSLDCVSAAQMLNGTGRYEDADVSDEAFARTTPAHVYQIHGHRNSNGSPTHVNDTCFNLEGKVELGGELRTVTLTRKGFEERSIQSY